MITSSTNPTLKLVRKLLAQKRKRDELGLFAVEGEDLVEAARAAGLEPVERPVAGENVSVELLAGVSRSRTRLARSPSSAPLTCRRNGVRRPSHSGA